MKIYLVYLKLFNFEYTFELNFELRFTSELNTTNEISFLDVIVNNKDKALTNFQWKEIKTKHIVSLNSYL